MRLFRRFFFSEIHRVLKKRRPCDCASCVDFRESQEWKWGPPVFTGPNRFRCGSTFNADCQSDGNAPCCSAGKWCGSTVHHCDCAG